MNSTRSDLEFRSPQANNSSSAEEQISSSSREDVTPTVPAENQEENPSVAPFSLSDQPSSDDKLGFRPYVQAIADFLMNQGTRPPLTLSVEGYWGSGKSSFMKQLQSEVENKGARTVWFNAWRYDKEESMLAAFAVALTAELGRHQSLTERLVAYTKLQEKRFGWASFAVDLLAKLTLVFCIVFLVYCLFRFGHIDLSKVFAKDAILPLCLGLGLPGTFLLGLAALRKLYKTTGNPLKIDLKKFANNPRYEERVPTIDKLHEDFERIVKCYAHGKKLFVFIDDLDRCDVPKSAEMMQALNLLLSDSLEVIYVIGLDRQKVAAGLAAKFKELAPYLSRSSTTLPMSSENADALEFGFDYLEKFIQLPYHLPEPSTDGIQTFLRALNGNDSRPQGDQRPPGYQLLVVELKSDGETVNRMTAMVAPVFDNNPRRIKQFINMFRLRALLAGRTGLLSKDPGPSRLTLQQLAKLVAIDLRWPSLLQDAQIDTTLLANLQRIVWTKTDDKTADQSTLWLKMASNPTETYWIGKSKLMNLIAAGFQAVYGDPFSPRREEVGRYGLHEVDLRCFLRVSPIVQARAATSADQASRAGKPSERQSVRTRTTANSAQSSSETSVPTRDRTAGLGTNPAQSAGWSDKSSGGKGPRAS